MHASRRPSPSGGTPRTATVSVTPTALDGLARATLEATAALVLVCDDAGRVLLANPALQRFAGRRREELVGLPFWEVVTIPEEVELARAAMAMVVSGRPSIPGEVDWLTGDGDRRRIELQTSVLTREDGTPYAIAFVGIDVTAHREREAQVRRQAVTDPLTGLANRSALFAVLAARLHVETGDGCSLVFCDLDGFKGVNDRFGHAAGDRLLVAVAGRLRDLAGPDDVVARLGGDEFVVVARGLDAEGAAERARRIEAAVGEPFDVAGEAVRIGVSTGTATGGPGDDPDSVMNRADMAMYGVKSVRRSRR
ncbi:diguanylate cyclase domain-containing protein [Geodermatophilus nigrescens]|uniref:Cyclic di-GMP phosphodiesterase Gmr n=1 Tax=Geodermatophilus nigrescens TaxID=1070870 RepID=A0A1M5QBD0_9ACTN|nr:diguanylate cyclase [Geodermatophilus nigrescens]SHH11342.1 cyclic di-GMP phosphodiesterase Gmr [Geodermatophilus nigrescens]